MSRNILKMKKIKIIFFFILILFCTNVHAQADHANQIADKIAQQMKDSLKLTGAQKNAIKDININLHELKKQARSKSTDRVIVGRELQRIENKRDSFYKTVLTEAQFDLYHTKKRNLVTNK